jgi:hypothetical protein
MVRLSIQYSYFCTKDFRSWCLAARDQLIQLEAVTIISHIEGRLSSKTIAIPFQASHLIGQRFSTSHRTQRKSEEREVKQVVIYRGFPLSISNKTEF